MEINDYTLEDAEFQVCIPHGFNQSWHWQEGPQHDWCRENCQGPWRGAMYSTNETTWLFRLESDAILFALRWS